MSSSLLTILLGSISYAWLLPSLIAAQGLTNVEDIDFSTIYFAPSLGWNIEQKTDLNKRIVQLWSLKPENDLRPSVVFLPPDALDFFRRNEKGFRAWSDAQIEYRARRSTSVRATFEAAFPFATKAAIMERMQFYESLRTDLAQSQLIRFSSTLVLTASNEQDLHDCCILLSMLIMDKNLAQDPAFHLRHLEGSLDTKTIAYVLRLFWLVDQNCSRETLSEQLNSLPQTEFIPPFFIPEGNPTNLVKLEVRVTSPMLPFTDIEVSRDVRLELNETCILDDYRSNENFSIARRLLMQYLGGFSSLIAREEFSEQGFFEEHSEQLVRVLSWSLKIDNWTAGFARKSFLERIERLAFDPGVLPESVADKLRTLPPITRNETVALNQVSLVDTFNAYREKAKLIQEMIDSK